MGFREWRLRRWSQKHIEPFITAEGVMAAATITGADDRAMEQLVRFFHEGEEIVIQTPAFLLSKGEQFYALLILTDLQFLWFADTSGSLGGPILNQSGSLSLDSFNTGARRRIPTEDWTTEVFALHADVPEDPLVFFDETGNVVGNEASIDLTFMRPKRYAEDGFVPTLFDFIRDARDELGLRPFELNNGLLTIE